VIDGYSAIRRPIAFSPDGRWLLSSWTDERLRLWPLPGNGEREVRALETEDLQTVLALDPRGRYVFATGIRGRAFVVPLDGGPLQTLEGFGAEALLDGAAVSPSGRLVAAASGYGTRERKALRVWDLETGEVQVFDLPEGEATAAGQGASLSSSATVTSLAFADESTIYSASRAGVLRWNLHEGSHETVVSSGRDAFMYMVLSADSQTALTLTRRPWRTRRSELQVHDLSARTTRPLFGFGDDVTDVTLDPSGEIAVTGDGQGIIRVGRIDGGPPHVLAGHEGTVQEVAISPDLRWVASSGEDNTLRLWPMPDLDATPLHALPHDELIAKLKSLTNLRAVRDPDAPAGWSIELGPFPGWRDVPTW
jgi:hypothetical protein